MPDLREQLQRCLQGRVCLVGVGNADHGDDGFGVRLAAEVAPASRRSAETSSHERVSVDFARLVSSFHDPVRGRPARFPRSAVKVATAFSDRHGAADAGSGQDGRAPVQGRHARPVLGLEAFPEPHPLTPPLSPSRGEGIRSTDEGEAAFEVIVAGTTPERHVSRLANGSFDTVLFLDAVESGCAPGSVVLLNGGEVTARFAQISTHKLSLGLLAQLIESGGRTRVWLLGVQPESLKSVGELSRRAGATLAALVEILTEVLVRKGALT